MERIPLDCEAGRDGGPSSYVGHINPPQIRGLQKGSPICPWFSPSSSFFFRFSSCFSLLDTEGGLCSDLTYPTYPVGWFLPLNLPVPQQFFPLFFCISSIPPSCKAINRKSLPLHSFSTHTHTQVVFQRFE